MHAMVYHLFDMACFSSCLQGKQSEWALVKRHESEDIFGVQVSDCVIIAHLILSSLSDLWFIPGHHVTMC